MDNLNTFAALSIKGPHHGNEDRFTIEPKLTFEDKELKDLEYISYTAVYDGHGGSFVVDYVKDNLLKNIVSALEKKKKMRRGESVSIVDSEEEEASKDNDENTENENDDVFFALRKGFHMTDKNVIDQCRKIEDWSGSCVCATLIHKNLLYLANLGDSTAVIFQFQPKTQIITKSITLSNPHRPKLEEQRIKEAGGWVSCDGYILGVLGCSRSMGDRELKYFMDFQKSGLVEEFQVGLQQKLKLSKQNVVGSKTRPKAPPCTQNRQKLPTSQMKPMVSSKPEITVFAIDPEVDALLIIGSDGLWDYISPKRSVELVGNAFAKNQNLDDVCQALVGAAQKAKSSDDVTVVVVALYRVVEEEK